MNYIFSVGGIVVHQWMPFDYMYLHKKDRDY